MPKLPIFLFAFAVLPSPVAMPTQAQSTNGADVFQGEVCIFEDADNIIWEDPDCEYVYVIRGDMLIYSDHGQLPAGAAVPGTGSRWSSELVVGCTQTISPSGRASSQCQFLPSH